MAEVDDEEFLGEGFFFLFGGLFFNLLCFVARRFGISLADGQGGNWAKFLVLLVQTEPRGVA